MSTNLLFTGGIALAIFALLAVFLVMSILLMREVPQGYAYILFRRGAPHRVLTAGTYWMLPFIDSIGHKIEVSETTLKIDSHTSYSKEGVPVHCAAELLYVISDPLMFANQVQVAPDSLANLVKTTLNCVVQKLDVKLIVGSRTAFNTILSEEINREFGQWGITVKRTTLTELSVPERHPQTSSVVTDSDKQAASPALVMPDNAQDANARLQDSAGSTVENKVLLDEISDLEAQLDEQADARDKLKQREDNYQTQSGFTYVLTETSKNHSDTSTHNAD